MTGRQAAPQATAAMSGTPANRAPVTCPPVYGSHVIRMKGLVQRTARLRPRAARSCQRSTRIVTMAATRICVASAAIGIQIAGS